MTILFSPPIAFLIYIGLVALVVVAGRLLAGRSSVSTNTHLYSSGELSPAADDTSVPGYRPFFVISLFFAVLHLGVVVLATSGFSSVSILYLMGLMMVLIVLIIG